MIKKYNNFTNVFQTYLTYESVARDRLGNSTTNNISRRKMLWDGQNRLKGISEDGYVSLYWYDADGNRTVKEHLGGEAVWVNDTKAEVKTDSMEYSIYPSPYISITGNRWTKHYYIGSERIASRTGLIEDFAALHTPDNHSAGNGQVASVNYAAIRQAEEDSIASYYAQLGVPYEVQHNTRGSGIHLYLPTSLLDDNRGTSTTSEETSGERDRGSLRDTSATLSGGQVYYYHRDPLGSTLSVSDSVGTLVQQVEYTPWGEVFVELRGDSTFTTPYLFNGKELDEETGLYYYGARYYDPKLSVWYSTDPMEMDYPWVSTYGYCLGNPIIYMDINGHYPIVTITKQRTGLYAHQKLLGYTCGQKRIASVPLYKAIVTDTEDANYKMIFYVTRDALVIRDGDIKGNKITVHNLGYEPISENQNKYSAKVMTSYPSNNKTLALKLTQNNSETVFAEANDISVEMGQRKKSNVANGIMIHVGGHYSYHNTSVVAGSYGCFGITNGEVNNSNDYSNYVIQSIIDQSQKSKTDKGRIDVIIEKRIGCEFKKSKTLIYKE